MHINLPENYNFNKSGGQISYFDLEEDRVGNLDYKEEGNTENSPSSNKNESSENENEQHEDELVTIVPKNNCLALVYRDVDTNYFHKYLNWYFGVSKFLLTNDQHVLTQSFLNRYC